MKLEHLTSMVVAAAAVALACGCSSAPTPKAASADRFVDPSVTGTTNLMSAHLLGPAPRVGKAHLSVDDDVAPASGGSDADDDAPKEARRSDGSRRGGGFGSAK